MNGLDIRARFPILASLIVAVWSTATRADTVQLPAMKDNTLYQNALGLISNGAGDYIFAGMTADNQARRAVLAFDITGNIPAGATITSVTLRLRVSRTIVGDETVTLHRLTADWGEGASNAGAPGGGGTSAAANDATWLHRFFPSVMWATAGGDFVAAPSASQTVGGFGPYTWGSTPQMVADVQAWLNGTAGQFGWIVLCNESTFPTAKRFDSRENPVAANRPLLTVEFTPPAGIPGDLNCDGVVNAADAGPFALALTDAAAYAAAFPACNINLADVNGDNEINGEDVDEFVALVLPP